MNTMRGQLPFPEGGDGVYLCILPGDLVRVRDALKIKGLDELVEKLEKLDAEAIGAVIVNAAKRTGEAAKVNVDAINLTLVDLRKVSLDVLFLGVYGKRYDEFIAEMVLKMEGGTKEQAGPSSGSGT